MLKIFQSIAWWSTAALQARTGYKSWECLSPDGFALNSKWNEAEKYICNPLSGEVPMECLSAKTLSGRSFRNSTTNRVTVSAPLVYSSRQIQTKPSTYSYTQEDVSLQFPIPGSHTSLTCSLFPFTWRDNSSRFSILLDLCMYTENKEEGITRDAGTQSTPTCLSSSSPSSTALTSFIPERSIKLSEDSPNSNAITKSEEEVCATFFSLFIFSNELVRDLLYIPIKTSTFYAQISFFFSFLPMNAINIIL